MAPVLSIHIICLINIFLFLCHMISYAAQQYVNVLKVMSKLVQNWHGCWSLLKGHLFCSQFGDQLIADLGELLDLLILQVRKRWGSDGQITNSIESHAHSEVRPTFWRTALSRDSTFICSFLRLALSATASVLALARTCAISSLALF